MRLFDNFDLVSRKNRVPFSMAMGNGVLEHLSFPKHSHVGTARIIIIYHDFLPTPRRGSHVKSGKTHTQSSRYTP